MPEQLPIWRIISMSYVVLIRKRCASSSLESASSSVNRSPSSVSMVPIARSMRCAPAE